MGMIVTKQSRWAVTIECEVEGCHHRTPIAESDLIAHAENEAWALQRSHTAEAHPEPEAKP